MDDSSRLHLYCSGSAFVEQQRCDILLPNADKLLHASCDDGAECNTVMQTARKGR